MGIKGLMKLLDEEANGCFREVEMKSLVGRTIAIDASMQLYQFMIQVRSSGESGGPSMQLMNEAGEVTSHLQGFFGRTIRLMEEGIKPVYVFDGKPPTMKNGELAKRREKKQKAEEELKLAEVKLDEAEGDKEKQAMALEEMEKLSKRTVSVTSQHNEEAKTLLRLMGLPVVEAPCEAEAQCAELCKKQKVFASGTEDMDTLTFGTPVLLRNLTQNASAKKPIFEIHYGKILAGLNLTSEQFVDLCILCGCDYCDSIKGVGPKSAIKLLREHKTIEEVVKHIDLDKHPVSSDFLANLANVRELFVKPEVSDGESFEFHFSAPNEEGVIAFLCGQKGFNKDRVQKQLDRLKKAKSASSQRRIESFFQMVGGSDSKAFNKPASKENGGKRAAGNGAPEGKNKPTAKKAKKAN